MFENFVSNFTNRLDAKGRVSVPASFRSELERHGFEGVDLYPALNATALEGGGVGLEAQIQELLKGYHVFSKEYEQLASALNGQRQRLKLDSEGRIQISEELKSYASIKDTIMFVGNGYKFRLWEPQQFLQYQDEAKILLSQVIADLSIKSR